MASKPTDPEVKAKKKAEKAAKKDTNKSAKAATRAKGKAKTAPKPTYGIPSVESVSERVISEPRKVAT